MVPSNRYLEKLLKNSPDDCFVFGWEVVNVMSAAEDLEPEGLTEAEENAEKSETPELPPDSPSPAYKLRARLRGRLMAKRSEDRSKAVHRNIRSTSPEY